MDSKRRRVVAPDTEAADRRAATERVEQLVAEGRSRLTARRMVELERDGADAGRARRHHLSR